LQARAPLASWARAGSFEFLAHARCERSGAATGGKVESLSERLARGGTATIPAQRGTQLG
jgi:hypothetical protein